MNKFITGEQFNVGVKQVATALDTKIKSLPERNVVNEISNPLTMSPLEYGYFKMSDNQTGTFVSETTKILFDTVVDGNMSINDGAVRLRKGVTYSIESGVQCVLSSATNIAYTLKDLTHNKGIIKAGLVAASNTGHIIGQPNISIIYTPEEDIDIALVVNDNRITMIYNSSSYFTIKEIRNNPVNQYGGFETEVLFEGASSLGINKFSSPIEKNNYVYIESSNEDVVPKRISPIMTSNTEPSPYEVTASSCRSGGYAIWKAFNGTNSGTYDGWSPSGDSGWIQIKLDKPEVVNGINIASRGTTTVTGPKDFIVYGSNDGAEYDPLCTVTNFEKITSGKSARVAFKNEKAYQYYKIDISSGYGSTTPVSVGYIELIYMLDGVKSVDLSKIVYFSGDVKLNDLSMLIYSDSFEVLDGGSTITKVAVIKGQLPSLLCGGEF